MQETPAQRFTEAVVVEYGVVGVIVFVVASVGTVDVLGAGVVGMVLSVVTHEHSDMSRGEDKNSLLP